MVAPVASGNQSIDSILEDLTNPLGILVSSIFSDSYSDADSDKFIGIIVTTNNSETSQGQWQWSSDGGENWNNISNTDLSETEGLFISEKDYVRFLPNTHFNGTPGNLGVRLIDTSQSFSSSTPTTNPFSLADAGTYAAPSFVDIDGVIQPAPAPRFSNTPGKIQHSPVEKGKHTREIIKSIGKENLIEELLKSKIIAEV